MTWRKENYPTLTLVSLPGSAKGGEVQSWEALMKVTAQRQTPTQIQRSNPSLQLSTTVIGLPYNNNELQQWTERLKFCLRMRNPNENPKSTGEKKPGTLVKLKPLTYSATVNSEHSLPFR